MPILKCRKCGAEEKHDDGVTGYEHTDCMAAALLRLRKALIQVTPSHRTPGKCWCGIGQDIEHAGHTDGCKAAREVLGVRDAK